MTPQHILEQKLRAAEDEAADWQRRAEHAEAQIKLARDRMIQAEDTMRGIVGQLGECVGCSKRRAICQQ